MTETRFDLSTVFATVARAVPDQEVLVWRDRRFTYRLLDARIDGVAHYFASRGLGCHTPRSALANHESGQDHVGLYLRNGNEYLESMVAGCRARVAPFNVNYRYVGEELAYLLADAGARGLVYHEEFAPQVAAIRDRLPGLEVLIQVADGSGNALLPGAVDYESIVPTPAPATPLPQPSGDDVYLLYTGGTTGMPKGVLWRQHDVFIAAMGGTPFGTDQPYRSYEEIANAARAAAGGIKLMMTAPFMHGAAQWSTFHIVNGGGKIVLPDDVHRLDWAGVLATVAREQVISIPVVGDAMARPMLDELETGKYDLSCLAAVNNGGAPLTPTVRKRLLSALPHVLLLDAVGSSETGIQMNHVSTAGAEAETAVFQPDDATIVVDELRERELRPGEGQGWLASKGRIPLGYLGDARKTAESFPVLNGQRYSVPGDKAVRLADGRIRLLGRDGVTINSGGEKIFAEEVERAVAAHPDVRDVVVVGRPSPKWGSEVVAVVQLAESADVSDGELLEECGRHVARYKVPKAIVRCPEVLRSPSGKADYRWAREQACAGQERKPDAPRHRVVHE
ncbi:acyl-CoA synthetase [Amycolatopsis acidicola]|uniref:Acyl-CoA synthetase n=1 Tax=Amycolatopsis acidicola TaxID=2596893 RepID=A0A5N0UYN7_9PSEU|nr:acyl-CoA synthetase [Amycolatopsis acidicola]KAA9156547.1 acyl-CoA synthetase [Amycolatopsis acidicola]